MCALLVGVPAVRVVGVGEWPEWLRIVVTTAQRLERATCCSAAAHGHGMREVELVDLPVFGRPARLVWRKQRWRCPSCRRAWTEQDPRIASARCQLTTRAARWATVQVGRHGRSVAEVADDLRCDWHTVMDAVALYGTALIEDPDRFGAVTAVGLDETLFARVGPFRSAIGRRREVLEYQVRQTATGADITLRTALPVDTEALTRELVDSLAALDLHTPRVRVSLVEAIPRPGNAGKVRAFVPLTGRS